ncbi:MAG: hypothetical protein EOP45_09985, partial [Sphingobacteriaceae bacterium]
MSISFGTIGYGLNGIWELLPNTDTVVPSENWICNSTSDSEQAIVQGQLLMPNSSGDLVVPYNGTFQVNASIDLANDFSYQGTGVLKLLYVPHNVNSESPLYTIATANIGVNSGVVNLVNNVIALEGDVIQLVWNLSDSVNIDMNDHLCNSWITFSDITHNTDAQYYIGKSGTPLAVGQKDSNAIMMTSPIVNNKAVFCLTQDGTPEGTAIFQKEISTFTIEVQLQGSTDTTLSPPGRSYILPYPANRKIATVVFSGNTNTSKISIETRHTVKPITSLLNNSADYKIAIAAALKTLGTRTDAAIWLVAPGRDGKFMQHCLAEG